MALRFPGPHCQATVTLRFLKSGERYLCKSCGVADTVPATADCVEAPGPIIPAPRVSRAQLPACAGAFPVVSDSFSLPDYIITDYSRLRREALQSSGATSLRFMRAFWTLIGWIIAYQLFSLFLEIYHNTDTGLSDELYYIVAEGFGMTWTILMMFYVIFDIQSHELKPLALFNFSLARLRDYAPKALKYFLMTAGVVLFFSLTNGGSQLQLERMSSAGIALAFLATVIVAPICEEMIFRGYLHTALRSQFHKPTERIAINAMLFAGAHVFLVMFFIGAAVPYYVFALGYFLAKLYEESNSVLPGIALHMLNNGLVFLIEWLAFQGFWFSIS